MATVTVRHAKVSAVADSSDANLIQPSDWNDNHAATLSGVVAADISDSTSTGRDVLTAANAAAGRTALSAAGSGAVGSSGLTMATARLLGRSTASTGAIEEIVVGSNLTLSGGTLSGTGGGASSLDGLSDVTLTAPADGDVLTYDSGTSLWVNAAPSGGGGGGSPAGRTDVAPVSTDFSWVNQGSSTVSDYSYGMTVTWATAGGTNLRMLDMAVPSAPYRAVLRTKAVDNPVNNPGYGIAWRESGTSEIQALMRIRGASYRVRNFNSPTSFSGDLATGGPEFLFDWFGLYDDNTTRYFQFSPDGNVWWTFASTPRTTFLTPDRVGLVAQCDAQVIQTAFSFEIIT